ncbi:MAG: FtsX-like permease family protein [bacterium]
MLFVKLAWRNLFRNKRRTILAGTAIGIGLASLIVVDALMLGTETNMIHSATGSFMGQGQIHGENYRATLEREYVITDPTTVLTELQQDSTVAHFTPRAMSFAMISSPANVVAGTMIGVVPQTERHLSQFDEALIEGEYFQGDSRYDLLIGYKLAELLEVALGDRVVITVAKAHTGELSQEMFRISGIYNFNTEELDRAMAIVRLPVAQNMLGLEGQAHEIAVTIVKDGIENAPAHEFRARYSTAGNEALGWRELMPQFSNVLEMTGLSTLIIGVVLFALVALGIINTLFMSLYERMFEFGVMRAVGTRPFGIGRVVAYEAAALAVVSILFGALLGWFVTYILLQYGIDYSGIEFAGVTFRERLYPELELRQFTLFPVLVFVFTVVVGLYPAGYAARMNAAEAMRRSF